MTIKWQEPLDPHDFKDYVASWAVLLASMADTIASVIVTRPLEAIVVGLEVDTATKPVSHDANKVTIWFKVNPTFQTDPAFEGLGTTFPIGVKITTAAERVIEKSYNLTVGQQ